MQNKYAEKYSKQYVSIVQSEKGVDCQQCAQKLAIKEQLSGSKSENFKKRRDVIRCKLSAVGLKHVKLPRKDKLSTDVNRPLPPPTYLSPLN